MGGSLSHAADAMRRMQRRMNRRAQESKDRRRARRLNHHTPIDDWGEPDRVSFPCALLCSSCGYFLRPDSDRRPEHCPHCYDLNWLDLSSDELVHQLREQESLELRRSVTKRRRKLFVLFVLGVVLIIIFPLPAWQLVILGGITALLSALYNARTKPERPTPSRWHTPRITSEPGVPAEFHGRVQSSSEQLSPITQQRCVGWRVSVLLDSTGEDGPFEIDEMKCSDLEIGGTPMDGHSIYIDTDPELVGPRSVHDANDPESVRLRRFLRSRGVSPSEGDFIFFETVIQNGDSVEWTRQGDVHVVRP